MGVWDQLEFQLPSCKKLEFFKECTFFWLILPQCGPNVSSCNTVSAVWGCITETVLYFDVLFWIILSISGFKACTMITMIPSDILIWMILSSNAFRELLISGSKCSA